MRLAHLQKNGATNQVEGGGERKIWTKKDGCVTVLRAVKWPIISHIFLVQFPSPCSLCGWGGGAGAGGGGGGGGGARGGGGGRGL